MSARRIMGMETEFGITDATNPRANVLALCAHIVQTYGERGSATGAHGAVGWDYTGENPLNDARGFKLDRASAHPSLLTDDPHHLAPSGESSMAADDAALSESLSLNAAEDLLSFEPVRRPSEAERALPKAPNAVLTNGARLYVDHAHPEYSAPEVTSPLEAVLWDRAGDEIAREAMQLCAQEGHDIVLYKNNVDGKGSAYGTHENYAMSRDVEFAEIVRVMTPFFVSRPVLCGAGRVGIGKRSEEAGFQISQRADYVENDVGIETTFDRPIINTRDEAHADETLYRRFHVIGGDANQFDVSNLLKVGTTSLVLWLLEQAAHGGVRASTMVALTRAQIAAPVSAAWILSHDPTCHATIEMAHGEQMNALDIQQIYLDAVRDTLNSCGDGGKLDADTLQVLNLWQEVLDGLRADPMSQARRVEWVAKYQMLESMRLRGGLSWDDDRLRAFDVQWHDLREDRSIVARLDQAGRIERVVTPEDVRHAVTHAPESTRAYLRGALIRAYPEAVAAAGWESVVLDLPEHKDLVRLALMYPDRATKADVGEALVASHSAADFLSALERA